VEGQVIRRTCWRAALATLVVAGACGGSPHPKAVVHARTESFRVLYRVVHSEVVGNPTVAWEVLTVKRPFVASDLTYTKRPDLDALGEPQTGTLADAEHL
jgi:hypothetical protein